MNQSSPIELLLLCGLMLNAIAVTYIVITSRIFGYYNRLLESVFFGVGFIGCALELISLYILIFKK